MAEYSRIAKGHVTNPLTGSSIIVNLPFQPEVVEFWNYTEAAAGAAAGTVVSGYWDVSMGQGQAVIQGYNSSALIYDVMGTNLNGISTFAAGQLLQYGALQILGGSGGIAKTSSTVLTVTTTNAHGLVPGNWVTFQNLYQTSTTGMQQIAGIPFEVLTVASSTTFTVGWVGNAANLTAITSGGYEPNGSYIAGFKQILYPSLYEPGVSYPWAITQTNGVVTVSTTAPHNFQVGQEIAFRIPSVYGATQLNSLPDTLIPGSPVYYYVVSASRDSFTFNYSGALTAFTVANTGFTSFPGLKFAQVVAVGDVNSGGVQYSGGNLYPSPLLYAGNSTNQSSTVNGPAIQGAFVNNTSAGFILGSGFGKVLTTSNMNGVTSDVIYWRAMLHDLPVN